MYERHTVNSVIEMLNKENAAVDHLETTQNLLLQKLHFDDIFHNEKRTKKYLLYISKKHAIIKQLQEVYSYILELLVKSLRSTDNLYDCHNTFLLGLNNSCINLQKIEITIEQEFFQLHL